MTRIKMHISNVKLPFYPLYEVKYGLQNRVSTGYSVGVVQGKDVTSALNALTNVLATLMGKDP